MTSDSLVSGWIYAPEHSVLVSQHLTHRGTGQRNVAARVPSPGLRIGSNQQLCLIHTRDGRSEGRNALQKSQAGSAFHVCTDNPEMDGYNPSLQS